ncbi:putative phage abortive infection protein [Bacillus atrophaeus]|uniref:putative phage abortive infection protein n=1 Tax=Bacillus atrophaeus TaxID=1452 RepID=UPI00227FF922|nr:putative phage abortive infection protein [Bacillus atrophaeus]MCY8912542.1 putative phage abortive infection protein [Bacillus atrophaeus]MCY9113960.1 putative phage abortive infection protein [Bacillus atrophaeus]MEC0927095.1 putative phage abortive infection protein [Bacillus atrophaeus]MEC0932065.1 putative phage abortive infection protein [Bacillus atrophaeus]
MLKRILTYLKSSENRWLIVGWLFVCVAVLTPTVILIKLNSSLNLKKFDSLGPIGDFLGGTTVGLLSLASIVFVVATISMQKKELVLQRKELTMQRDELKRTREEFELSNQTLLKQQFENTFFNMINLHHNILKDLIKEVDGKVITGRNVIKVLYSELNHKYYEENMPDYIVRILNGLTRYKDIDDMEIHRLAEKLQIAVRKIEFVKEHYLKNSTVEEIIEFINTIDHDWEELEYQIMRDSSSAKTIKIEFVKEHYLKNSTMEEIIDFINTIDHDWEELKHQVMLDISPVKTGKIVDFIRLFAENKIVNDFCKGLHTLDLCEKLIQDKIELSYLVKMKNLLVDDADYQYKTDAYESMYNNNEENIGHYFRNLYRIVKFIEDHRFSADEDINELEKRKYRGVLRAQLSSNELLMLFYNVVYSEKGKKFALLLKGKNFFDDHLVPSAFVWKNDNTVLEKLN